MVGLNWVALNLTPFKISVVFFGWIGLMNMNCMHQDFFEEVNKQVWLGLH